MWCGQAAIEDNHTEPPLIAELRANGVPDWVIDQVKANYKATQDGFLVWADNWESVTLFCEISNLWRIIVSMTGGMYLGFDWVQIQAFLTLKQCNISPDLIADIQHMEREALPLLNKNQG